jgi:hypothetical protein
MLASLRGDWFCSAFGESWEPHGGHQLPPHGESANRKWCGLARGETTAGCWFRLGVELPLLFAVGAFALALTGPGRFSLDALLGLEALMTPRVAAAALAIGILGGLANLAVRRATPGQPSTR